MTNELGHVMCIITMFRLCLSPDKITSKGDFISLFGILKQ